MGTSTSKMKDVVHDKIVAIAVIATLALLFGITSLVINLWNYYNSTISHNNVVNLSAVPGQTDVTGNVKLMGELHLGSWLEATSGTEASFTTNGGIAALGKIIAERGLQSKNIDSNEILKIGPETQLGIEMGRDGFPILFKGNQLICPKTMTRDILPLQDSNYNLGNNDKQWQNLYLSGNVYNKQGCATNVGSGGMFNQIVSGPILKGSGFDSLLDKSMEKNRILNIHHFIPGDCFQLFLSGHMTISKPNEKQDIPIAVVCNDKCYYVPLKIDKKDLLHYFDSVENEMYTDNFIIRATFHTHKKGYFLLVIEMEWGSFKKRSIHAVSIEDDNFTWDVKIYRDDSCLGDNGFIQAQTCVLSKIY